MQVLIAEDEAVSRRILESSLHKWGYEVATARNGREAWTLFEEQRFPLVITDWMMPEGDGLELLRRIRGRGHAEYTFVFLLTSRNQKQDLMEAMDAGADDFLTKPFDQDELRVRLRAAERLVRLEHDLAQQNRALREAQAALVQSEKLASLGRLAAGVAHEINNPVSYVRNNLVVLQRDTAATLEVLDAYGRGEASAAQKLAEEADLGYFRENCERLCLRSLDGLQRVSAIVHNLRDFARLEEASFKEIDVNAALESTLGVVRHEASERKVEVVPELERVGLMLGHPGKINQVFLNVLVNALEACEPGGRVVVRTRAEPGGGVRIEIEDNGQGIAPEHRARLFEPFFTTKPVGKGTGLGLSVSFGIVRDHGGSIEVDSEVGRGSVFRIRLPSRPPNGASPTNEKHE